MTDEIRGNEVNARKLADPARLRLLSARLKLQAEHPPSPPARDPLDRLLVEHERQYAGIIASMATILDACANRIEAAEAELQRGAE